MDNDDLNSFWLISIGAGFFATSINKGRAGELKKSIVFAALTIVVGLAKAQLDGVFARETTTIIAVTLLYVVMPVTAVIVSRRMFNASQSQECPANSPPRQLK